MEEIKEIWNKTKRINEMKKLGMAYGPGSDIQRELDQKLAGTVAENTGDDQLLGEAAKLQPHEFKMWIKWRNHVAIDSWKHDF